MRTPLGAPIALAVFAAGLSTSALAAELPPIKASESNAVAECATPGRLTAFLKASNAKLAPKFEAVATEYMRHGEELGIRWDFAYFQMLLETGYLKYSGDVKPDQNNFAGLGATGRGVSGESFKDVASGVRAHLEHLLVYAGDRIESPVAERTRNIQDWGVLTSWQKSLKGPVTFGQLAKKWAPGSRGYGSDIAAIADRFMTGPCLSEDPAPELVAEARKGRESTIVTGAAATDTKQPTKGDALARAALEAARAEGTPKAGLGAGTAAAANAGEVPAAAGDAAPAPSLNILNATPEVAAEGAAAPDATAPAATESAKIEAAALATGTKPSENTSKEPQKGCRVWTASYGGAKAVIIKAVQAGTTNYTVLDVNEGAEEKESEAYIAAYAKGGQKISDFTSQRDALDKAFELCPEG